MTSNQPKSDLDFALELDFSEILTNPILDIGARVWEKDRYEAFKVCYRSMRVLDDLVDNRKAEVRELAEQEKVTLTAMINDWVRGLKRQLGTDPFQRQLLEMTERFAIPIWPWEKLAEAMIWDIYNDRFPTLRSFIRYSEGAAVAPASIFLHLCGVRCAEHGCLPPLFDIRSSARMLARFSYVVHILRDFEKDQRRGLNYFGDNILAEHDVAHADLRTAAESGEMPAKVRAVMDFYLRCAENYRARARRTLDRLEPQLEPRYSLSLELIYELYLQIYERLNEPDQTFSEATTLPLPDAVEERINSTIVRFNDRAF